MEVSGVTPSNALQAVLAALAEMAEVAALPESATARSDAGLPTHDPLAAMAQALAGSAAHDPTPNGMTAEATELHPDARIDKGAETARLQTFGRPSVPQADMPRPTDSAFGQPGTDGLSFSLPGDQLVNATLIGLQVQPAFAWPVLQRGNPPATAEAPPPRTETPAVDADSGHPEPEQPDGEPAAPEEHASVAPRSGVAFDAADDDWCEPLSRALREALRGSPAPHALQAAADQWKLGRCVVLACPQGADPSAAAWAFVLWPKPGSRPGLPLALFGLRVDARLHWARVPPAIDWCHARVMKEQHPRQGRQLVALDAKGTAAVACEVQLGPVPLRTPRWRDACVRIDAVRRFWSALGEQWSVTVVVGSRPLPGLPAPSVMEATC